MNLIPLVAQVQLEVEAKNRFLDYLFHTAVKPMNGPSFVFHFPYQDNNTLTVHAVKDTIDTNFFYLRFYEQFQEERLFHRRVSLETYPCELFGRKSFDYLHYHVYDDAANNFTCHLSEKHLKEYLLLIYDFNPGITLKNLTKEG